jgi:uncharacterized protein YbjT (DUF2867 family)
MNDRIVAIAGATGQQGGATTRALAGKGFRIRALTRSLSSEAARALAASGVDLAPVDFDDEASIGAALSGAWGAYAVQNSWTAGVEREEEQGHRFARVARDVGVQHFVYTSVGSAHRKTGIPHFDSKARIEDTVRGLGFPSYAIVRPVAFMENLLTPAFLHGDTLMSALQPTTAVQMIAVRDIGQYGALAFTDARLRNREIDIAGDAVTMARAAETLSRALGRSLSYVQVPMSEIRKRSDDVATMLEWFERVGYDADIAGNAREFGVVPTSLDAWAATLPGQAART